VGGAADDESSPTGAVDGERGPTLPVVRVAAIIKTVEVIEVIEVVEVIEVIEVVPDVVPPRRVAPGGEADDLPLVGCEPTDEQVERVGGRQRPRLDPDLRSERHHPEEHRSG